MCHELCGFSPFHKAFQPKASNGEAEGSPVCGNTEFLSKQENQGGTLNQCGPLVGKKNWSF